MAALGELVAAGRRRQRLSREDLGALLRRPGKPQGVWSTYIGQVERGTRVPPDSTVLQLAEVLGIDARRLLAAAYASRARTPLGRRLFAMAPLLLLARDAVGPDAGDLAAAVAGLQRLAAADAEVSRQRLLEALADLEPLDEGRWNLLRNAAAAARASTSDPAPAAPAA